MKKEKKQKRKVKLKNKKIIIPILLITGVILGIGGYFGLQYFQKNIIKSIQKNYSEYVVTTKKSKLYDKKKKEIGEIEKEVPLILESKKEMKIESTYLKIKGTNYYISYKNIKKAKETLQEENKPAYYVSLNQTLETKKETKLQ